MTLPMKQPPVARSPVTLLERLAAAGDRVGRARSTAGDAQRLRASILANLRRILGTRLGHAQAQPELGTPAPSELIRDHPACIARLQRAIGSGIQRYEPRLTAVRVQHLPGESGETTIRFAISAVLADGSRTPVTFATKVDDHGRLDLTS